MTVTSYDVSSVGDIVCALYSPFFSLSESPSTLKCERLNFNDIFPMVDSAFNISAPTHNITASVTFSSGQPSESTVAFFSVDQTNQTENYPVNVLPLKSLRLLGFFKEAEDFKFDLNGSVIPLDRLPSLRSCLADDYFEGYHLFLDLFFLSIFLFLLLLLLSLLVPLFFYLFLSSHLNLHSQFTRVFRW